MSGERGQANVQVVLGFFAAIRDQRTSDLLALVDPQIICMPVTRPGRTVYEGHAGMLRFIKDLHAVFGDYEYEIDKITELDEAKVAVQARMLLESGRPSMGPLSISVVFTLRNGLITLADSEPGTSQD
jgi:hypothetical protein